MAVINLQGKRVIVTGAAGGLGRAFAEGFARSGACVVAADINSVGIEETVGLIQAAGGIAHAAELDVTDAGSTQAVAEFARDRLGGIDVLVNNAAIYSGLRRARFEAISESEWDRVMAVNVKGLWQMTCAVSPTMRAAGRGAVINVSSGTVMAGSTMWLHYVASKGAVIAMTRSMAREMGGDKITVNAIAPGLTMTDASLSLIENATEREYARGSIKRPALAVDMVGGALFFASDAAEFISGQTLLIDGGRDFL